MKDFYKDINTHFQKIYKLVGKRKELNTLGYVYLRAGKTTEALLTFQMNTFFFPKDAYVYYNYAEALETSGDKEKAIEMYETVILLYPEYKGAQEKIELLKKEEK